MLASFYKQVEGLLHQRKRSLNLATTYTVKILFSQIEFEIFRKALRNDDFVQNFNLEEEILSAYGWIYVFEIIDRVHGLIRRVAVVARSPSSPKCLTCWISRTLRFPKHRLSKNASFSRNFKESWCLQG